MSLFECLYFKDRLHTLYVQVTVDGKYKTKHLSAQRFIIFHLNIVGKKTKLKKHLKKHFPEDCHDPGSSEPLRVC